MRKSLLLAARKPVSVSPAFSLQSNLNVPEIQKANEGDESNAGIS
jgi:hypothetical protein